MLDHGMTPSISKYNESEMIKSCLFPTCREAAMGLKVLRVLLCIRYKWRDKKQSGLRQFDACSQCSIISILFWEAVASIHRNLYMDISEIYHLPTWKFPETITSCTTHGTIAFHQELPPRQLGRTMSRTWRIIVAPYNPNCQRHRSRRKTLMLALQIESC